MKRFKKPEVVDLLYPFGSTVIEASAGTGKTYALEHIVLDMLIRSWASIDEVLVLTYTERATQELKARIRALIEACLNSTTEVVEGPHWQIDEKVRLHLETQLDQFARASIHTIHGFCHRILTENAFHLNRRLQEEQGSASNIFDRAFKRALREKLATIDPFRNFLEVWLSNHSLRDLQYDLEFVCRYSDPVFPKFNQAVLLDALDEIASFSQPEIAFRQECGNDWIADVAQNVVAAADQYANHRNLPQFLADSDSALGILRGARRKRDQATMGEIGAFRATSEEAASVRKLLLNVVPLRVATIQMFSDVVRPYVAQEKAKGFFDFDDMLDGVHRRLQEDVQGSAELRAFLRSRYRYALVDEFQDTDAKQWDICQRIFVDSPDNGNPLIIIGDPKQSIYGWRGADVRTYLDAKRYVAEKSSRDVVHLQTNYRSTASMIAAYNTVFDQQDRDPFFDGDITYDQPVDCGEPDTVATQNGEPIVPFECITPMTKDEATLDAFALKRVVARKIGHEIRQLLDHPITITSESGERTVGPSDIYVLTHTHEEARFLGQFLRGFNIPHAYFKQEGLFQTEEAQHVLDVLRAVAQPYDASRRLRAWATPFFCAPWKDLHAYRDLPETDPFFATLLRWHQLAQRRDFETLFALVIDGTGTARREIFDGDGFRKLTNYTHILETLLDEASRERLEIDDVILRLDAFVKKSRLTERDERNIQRLDSHGDAVQLMTIHTSKGLEADVVFIYGGFSRGGRRYGPQFVHHNGKRAIYYGAPQSERAKQMMDERATGETQRLLYVALTRARVKTVVPFIDSDSKGRPLYRRLDGHHSTLNARLASLFRRDAAPETLFHRNIAYVGEWLNPPPAKKPLRSLTGLVLPEAPTENALEDRPEPLVMTSYSRMKKGAYEVESFQTDRGFDVEAEEEDLPSGTTTGIFLHDLLENIDFADLANADSYESWSAREDVRAWCSRKMEEQGIESKFLDRCLLLVWNSVSTPFDTSDGEVSSLAAVERERREVEFYVPIPQSDHPIDGVPKTVPLEIDRGYLKGFIDLVFEHDGRIYFADWKSDALPSFDDEVVQRHVERNYGVQASLYTFALSRMFGAVDRETYERKIGGYLYVFMRGISGERNRGFYTGRLSWDELEEYRERLLEMTFS